MLGLALYSSTRILPLEIQVLNLPSTSISISASYPTFSKPLLVKLNALAGFVVTSL